MPKVTKLLDHGYITLIEGWGSDQRIIEAARMSTDKGFKGWGPRVQCRHCGCLWRDNGDNTMSLFDADQKSCEKCEHEPMYSSCKEVPGDEKLLAYLYRNRHSTPFEMAGLTVEVQAPIFVFRQWHRHRTQSYNEMSARYTPLPNMHYVPTAERLLVNSKTNKQAGTVKGAAQLSPSGAKLFQARLEQSYFDAETLYQEALAAGVPKELARVHLPVARYSRMRASANLRNWLGFLTLRMDPHAQYEIRVYAEALGDMVKDRFPRTWELFLEGMGK